MFGQVRSAEPHLGDVSDRSLVRRLRTGSQDAATQLYLRYAKRLHALSRAKCSPDLAARVDSDDIVQSVFRTFFRRVGKGEYDVPDGEELWKLFLVIGLNKIQTVGTFHRAAKRDVRSSLGGDVLDHAAEAAEETDATSLSVLQMSIDEVLGELSPSHRDIIQLRIEGHEVAAIAEQLGRSKRSVERILQGFREQMAGLIREDE
ncbi:MAG: sigma-70 family RNA polymerase sigma factor [Planctomycetia bacterium]|nr:sigma-70 family RNA polymerase sigma factor [Planctomycetia bacterium]